MQGYCKRIAVAGNKGVLGRDDGQAAAEDRDDRWRRLRWDLFGGAGMGRDRGLAGL